MKNRGFVLIEIIIYIGLFAIMIGGLFVSVFQIMQGSQGLEEKVTIEEEMNFVVKKIDWLLNDMTEIISPLSGTDDSLEIVKRGEDEASVALNEDGEIEMCVEEDCFSITSVNISVEEISFEYLPAVGTSPAGINTTMNLSGRVVSWSKYLKPWE